MDNHTGRLSEAWLQISSSMYVDITLIISDLSGSNSINQCVLLTDKKTKCHSYIS